MIEYNKKTIKSNCLDIISTIIVNMIVIIMATRIFKNIYVENVFYTFLAACLLTLFNKSIKPILKLIMLPITIFTLGISYPLINIIILKIIGLFLGNHFFVSGWFSAFFISIFISLMTIIIDILIGRNLRKV